VSDDMPRGLTREQADDWIEERYGALWFSEDPEWIGEMREILMEPCVPSRCPECNASDRDDLSLKFDGVCWDPWHFGGSDTRKDAPA
jgi:hypothetical protein